MTNRPVVYTKPSCVQCKAVYRWMESRDVEYDTIDLSKDLDKLAEFQDRGILSAPITEWNGETIVGFNPTALAECLKEAQNGA